MNLTKLDKKYVSEIDQFLVEFDKKNPKRSASQTREIQNAERVSCLMQTSSEAETEQQAEIWDQF